MSLVIAVILTAAWLQTPVFRRPPGTRFRKFTCLVKPPTLLALLIVGALTLSACGISGSKPAPLIFAAASLADVLDEAATAYEQQTGSRVQFSFGGSTTLANQIASAGAPADAVIFAGAGPMRVLVDEGIVEASHVMTVASNRLVVVRRRGDSNIEPGSFREMVSAGSIAIADPALAPAGAYARAALENIGVWEVVQPRLVPSLDVRAALAAVETDNADWGIVYLSDALSSPGVEIVVEIPPQTYPTISYLAAAIRASSTAVGFINFLRTATGQSILETHGFGRTGE